MRASRPLLVVSAIAVLFGVVFWARDTASDASPDPLVPGGETSATPALTEEEAAAPTSVIATTIPPLPEVPAYVVTHDGARLVDEEGGETRAAAGLLMPVLSKTGDGYRTLNNCNTEVTVSASEVDVGAVPVGGTSFGDSVFVIDPGHGLPDYGAIGPQGLSETVLNLDVSNRLADLLDAPRDIDWETGAVTPGDTYPAVAAAILTRDPAGPNGGDYELSLTFRATVANAADATALVSVHHNSSPETDLDRPGSEALVAANDADSARLGGLIVEELRSGLARFDADWVGSTSTGLVSRVGADGGDYYSILARSDVTAVIVEASYISNPTEEAMAMTDEYRQVTAEAIYRALVRFVTTDDFPIPAPEPVLWEAGPTTSTSGCQVPTP